MFLMSTFCVVGNKKTSSKAPLDDKTNRLALNAFKTSFCFCQSFKKDS